MAVEGARVPQPLPVPQAEYDQRNQALFRRQIEINFQDMYVELDRISDELDTLIASITHPPVTLTGTPDYITINVATQVITRNPVDLAADVGGDLPPSNLDGGLNADATTFWRGDGTWVVANGWGDCVDADILPCVDSTINIGHTANRFLSGWYDAVTVEGNIEIDGGGWGIFPNRLGVGGTGVPNNTTGAPLQVQGDATLEGGLGFYDTVGAQNENVIFQTGTGPGSLFAKVRNFISDSTLWGVRSRAGDPLVDDREATLALVRTNDVADEEVLDLYNNGFHTTFNDISLGYGIRIIKQGTGLWRPFRFDWFTGTPASGGIPGYTILSPDDPGGPCFIFHVPVKFPMSNLIANDLFMETDLGSFVLSRATSHKPWTAHDRCASNAGFS